MEDRNNEPSVTVGSWLVTLLIMCIPFINFIMLFVWAFGGGSNTSKANWAKATLLLMLIGFVVAIIFFMLMGAVGVTHMMRPASVSA